MNEVVKKKTMSILWAILYTVLVIGICFSSCYVFHNYYYRSIFVSGPSMQPTLKGGRNEEGISDFGIVDPTKRALDNIKRFDIVTTYFPWSDYDINGKAKDNADYKIKRVIALPGESILIDNKYGDEDFAFHIKSYHLEKGQLIEEVYHYNSTGEGTYGENEEPYIKVPFNRTLYVPSKMHYKNTYEDPINKPWSIGWIDLKDDEYWVMGDNLSESTDSAYVESGKNHGPVKYKNLVGVLVAIEGTCKIVAAHYDDAGKLIPATCKDRKYHLPKVF